MSVKPGFSERIDFCRYLLFMFHGEIVVGTFHCVLFYPYSQSIFEEWPILKTYVSETRAFRTY